MVETLQQEYLEGMLDRTLRYYSKEEVEKVRDTVVAVSGLGGVGTITVELLARWGVKKFRLLDMDRYETSNLNRQLFATSKTLGQSKVDIAAARIKEINPYAEIEMTIPARVDNENVHKFVKGAGIVIQNADHPSCKLFYLAARRHKVPLVNGYATITGGRVQTFDYHRSPCESRLESMWNRFKYGDSKSLTDMNPEEIANFDQQHVHSTAPSVNYVVNMVGCLIVAEAIKLITGRGRVVIYPRYLEFDSLHWRFGVRNSLSLFNPANIKRLMLILKKILSRITGGYL